MSILSSHLQLQNEGFLSTWTNSFVGPWDPSQGVHNPGELCKLYLRCSFWSFYLFSANWIKVILQADEKIKLWLFLPGWHSSVSESAHAAVSRLRGTSCWKIFIEFMKSFNFVILLNFCFWCSELYWKFFLFHISLAVIASGVWSAPGDSEEVALALSQSLRNRIERFSLVP